MGVQQGFHRPISQPPSKSRRTDASRGSSKSAGTTKRPASMPNKGLPSSTGTSRATGCPERVMTTSSPAHVLRNRRDRCVFASCTLTFCMEPRKPLTKQMTELTGLSRRTADSLAPCFVPTQARIHPVEVAAIAPKSTLAQRHPEGRQKPIGVKSVVLPFEAPTLMIPLTRTPTTALWCRAWGRFAVVSDPVSVAFLAIRGSCVLVGRVGAA